MPHCFKHSLSLQGQCDTRTRTLHKQLLHTHSLPRPLLSLPRRAPLSSLLPLPVANALFEELRAVKDLRLLRPVQREEQVACAPRAQVLAVTIASWYCHVPFAAAGEEVSASWAAAAAAAALAALAASLRRRM